MASLASLSKKLKEKFDLEVGSKTYKALDTLDRYNKAFTNPKKIDILPNLDQTKVRNIPLNMAAGAAEYLVNEPRHQIGDIGVGLNKLITKDTDNFNPNSSLFKLTNSVMDMATTRQNPLSTVQLKGKQGIGYGKGKWEVPLTNINIPEMGFSESPLAKAGSQAIDVAAPFAAVKGAAKPFAAGAYTALGGGFNAGVSALGGDTNYKKNFIEGANTTARKSAAFTGFSNATNPLLDAIGGKALTRLPLKSAASIAQGIGLDQTTDMETTPKSLLLDALFPLAGELKTKSFKSADEAVRVTEARLKSALGKSMRNNKGMYTTADKFAKGTRAYRKSGKYMQGGLLGFERYEDENGEWRVRFNRERALIGLGATIGVGKAGKLTDDALKGVDGDKVRGFAQTVADDLSVPKEVREFALTQTYKPLSNDVTMKQVGDIVKKGDSQAISFAKTDEGILGNATAMVMIRKLLAENRFNEAQDLIQSVSPRFTKQGQEIQILSQFGKLTPEGSVKYAQHLIDLANKANPKLKLKLTEENLAIITKRAGEIQGFKEGSRDHLKAVALLMKEIKGIVPKSAGQKIATIQTMAQLLNFKTPIRNVLGNLMFSGLENVSDVVGTGIDRGVSLVTGQRAKVLPSLSTQLEGGIRGGKEGLEDVRLGIDTSGGLSTQFDLPTPTFSKGVLNNLEKGLNLTLRVPDRVAFTAAFDNSLNNQMRAAGVSQPTPQMIEIARADGLYRTFQDNSKLAQIFTGIKKLLNKVGTPDGKFGLGDLLLKYPKTPANILARGVDYSPAGFVKGLYEAGRPMLRGTEFNQKAFVEDFSRATVGTGVIAAGYILADKGIISGKKSRDRDIAATEQATGAGQFKFNVSAFKRLLTGNDPTPRAGDKLASYDWALPTSLEFSIGADLRLNGQGRNNITSGIDSINASTDALTEQPLVRGVTDFMANVGDPNYGGLGSAVVKTGLSVPASFTPSLLNQFASLFDPTARNTYDPSAVQEAKNRVVTRMPFLRQSLEPSIDVLGNERANYESSGVARIVDVLFNPAFVTTLKDNPSAAEVLRIYNEIGETKQAPRVAPKYLTVQGVKTKFSARQYAEFQRFIGTKTQEAFDWLITTDAFQQASDSDRAEMMADVLTGINKAAKEQVNLMETSPDEGYTASKDNQGLVGNVKGLFTSPKGTINAWATGQPIRKVENGRVVVERKNGLFIMDRGDKNAEVDHIIPLSFGINRGGTNANSNLTAGLPKNQHDAKTIVGNYLLKQMDSGAISSDEGITKIKNWENTINELPQAEREKATRLMNTPVATQEARSTGGEGVSYINQNGKAATMDIYSPIEKPEYTGNAVYDKKLKSKYTSAISKRQNDLIYLIETDQLPKDLTKEDAIAIIEELEGFKKTASSGGKGKKAKKINVKTPKIKLGKTNTVKGAISKPAKFKAAKAPVINLSLKPIKAGKINLTKRKYPKKLTKGSVKFKNTLTESLTKLA